MAVNKLTLMACTVLYLGTEYDVMIGVNSLDEVTGVLQEWALNKWDVELDLPSALVECQAVTEVLTSLSIDDFVYLQSPVAAYMTMQRYAGISGDLPIFPTELDTGGKYTLPTCLAFLWSEPGYEGYFGEYIIPISQDFALLAGINHIGISFNLGAPAYFLTADLDDFNYSSIIPVVTVLNFESGIYVIPFGQTGYGLPEKTLNLNALKNTMEIMDPYTLEIDTMYIQLGATKIKKNTQEISCGAVDTSLTLNDMYLHYKDVYSEWQYGKTTQVNNTQYQSASGLASLSPGEYVINNIFRVADKDNLLLFNVLSGKFASFQTAVNSIDITDLPPEIAGSAVLVGRVIVAQGSTTPSVQVLQKNPWGLVA